MSASSSRLSKLSFLAVIFNADQRQTVQAVSCAIEERKYDFISFSYEKLHSAVYSDRYR